jgi:hypothetical protein
MGSFEASIGDAEAIRAPRFWARVTSIPVVCRAINELTFAEAPPLIPRAYAWGYRCSARLQQGIAIPILPKENGSSR